MHIVVLYLVFNTTKNGTYHIMQAIFAGLLILTCFIPRLVTKYYAFLATIILFSIMSLASVAVCAVLIQKYPCLTQLPHLHQLLRNPPQLLPGEQPVQV